jgi:Holliday junction resolvase
MTAEASLQSKIIKYLERKGCYVVKTGGPGTPNGCPDIIALLDGGGWFALEVKASARAKFQPLQKATISKLDNMWFSRAVWPENWDEVKAEIEKMI